MKMTRILLLCIGLTICCNLAACSADSTPEGLSPEEQQAIEKAKIHAQMLIEGNFAGVLQDSTVELQSKITVEQLSEAWQRTVAGLGEYSEIKGTSVESKNGMINTETTLAFNDTKIAGAQNGLLLTLSYDAKGKIGGLWIKPVALNQELVLEDNEVYQETSFAVGEYGLTGILAIPKAADNPPIVIMVQGSGSTDYDETVGANKPFKQLSDALAKNGIMTIRYNKRFYQNNFLANEKYTINEEFLEDVYWLVDYAEDNFDGNIYILGHSLGAMAAPKIAAEKSAVKGVICLAGTPRGLEEVIYDQNMRVIAEGDYTDEQKSEMTVLAKNGLKEVQALRVDNGSAPLGVPAAYWLSLRDLKTAENAAALDIPILIMQGGKDFQVSAEVDYLAWKKALGNKDNVNYKLYDNLNHLFMPSVLGGKLDIAEYDTPGEIPDQVITDIVDWLDNK